jgi:hypothetical protein
MSQQRQQITLVQEGSILVAQQQPVIGAIADVRPDYRAGKSTYPHPKYGRDVGTPHPVYRSGLALTVPVTAPMK